MRLTALDRDLARLHKSNTVSQLLAEIPGVGPISALSFALTVDVSQFRSGRHLAAWLGLTPKQKSTAASRGWRISRQATNGCDSCWCSAQPPWSALSNHSRQPAPGCWPCCSAVRASSRVALANKMARVVWP